MLLNNIQTFEPSAVEIIKNAIEANKISNFLDESIDKIIAYHPILSNLGDSVVSKYGNLFKLPISWSEFNDFSPNIMYYPYVSNMELIFLFDVFHLEYFAVQLMLLRALGSNNLKSLTIVIPYYGVGTMERSDQDGVLATANEMAKIISGAMSDCRTSNGYPQLVFFDIHAIVERYYFSGLYPVYVSGLDLLYPKKITFTLSKSNEKRFVDAIVFPDDGAYKRFKNNFPSSVAKIICSKLRVGDTRRIVIQDIIDSKRINFKSFLIVDDLIQTGNTLIECAKAIHAHFESDEGKAYKDSRECKIAVYATHGVFPKDSWIKFAECDLIDKIYITNTINKKINEDKFEILDIVDLFPIFIKGLVSEKKNRSVSVLVFSNNQRKLYGTYMAFLLKKKYANIQIKYIESCEKIKQPIGIEETIDALKNRFDFAHGLKFDYYVYSQNGICFSNKKYSDKCYSIVIPSFSHEAERKTIALKNKDYLKCYYNDLCDGKIKENITFDSYLLQKSVIETVLYPHNNKNVVFGNSYGVEVDISIFSQYLEYCGIYKDIAFGEYLCEKYELPKDDWYSFVEEKPRWYMIYSSIFPN